jgi:hypothetical protein
MAAKIPPAGQTRQIVEAMLSTIARHKGATFTMDATERLVGKASENNRMKMFTKVNINPHKIYSRVLSDLNKGTELLYVTGERNGKIKVNANKMLVPNLNLEPTNSLLSKNQHHTLLSSGFMIVYHIVSDGVKRADERGEFDKIFKILGEVNYQNHKCYKLEIDDPTYTYLNVTGKVGENVTKMASRLLVSEYHIMELNPSYRSLDDNVSGKSLKVPSSYAKKTVLYIDKETNMPIYQEMSDDKGMFEKYEYSNVVINPAFKADEFSDKFSEYKF